MVESNDLKLDRLGVMSGKTKLKFCKTFWIFFLECSFLRIHLESLESFESFIQKTKLSTRNTEILTARAEIDPGSISFIFRFCFEFTERETGILIGCHRHTLFRFYVVIQAFISNNYCQS